MKNDSKQEISQSAKDYYYLLTPLLQSAYKEMSELSKKRPESPLNMYKVKMINRILIPLKELLKNETVADYLDVLDTDDLPTNSDVVLIMSQYNKAVDMFYEKHLKIVVSDDSWDLDF